jgi:hypothetical protein
VCSQFWSPIRVNRAGRRLAGGRIHVENDDSLHMCNYKIKEATRSQTIRI